MTVVRFHWLLALLAILTPTSFLFRPERTATGTDRETLGLSSAAETVFRHYV